MEENETDIETIIKDDEEEKEKEIRDDESQNIFS